jgi:hypothetical protein
MNKIYKNINIETTTYYGNLNDVFVLLNKSFPYPPFSYYTVPESSGNILIEEEYEKKLFFNEGEGRHKTHTISFKEPGEYIIPITSLSNSNNKEYNIKFIIRSQNKSSSTNCAII